LIRITSTWLFGQNTEITVHCIQQGCDWFVQPCCPPSRLWRFGGPRGVSTTLSLARRPRAQNHAFPFRPPGGGLGLPKWARLGVKDRRPEGSCPPHILAFLAIQFSKSVCQESTPKRRFQKITGAAPSRGRHRTREAERPQAFSANPLDRRIGRAPPQAGNAGPCIIARGLLPVNPLPGTLYRPQTRFTARFLGGRRTRRILLAPEGDAKGSDSFFDVKVQREKTWTVRSAR